MDVKGKGKASVEAKAEADEAPVVDTDVIDTR
jgi:hypothetical protein